MDRLETEISNLTAAIAAGGELTALVKALKDREQERERVRRQLANTEVAERRTQVTPTRLRDELERRFADWRGILHRQPQVARQIIRKLLVGPIRFTPSQGADGRRYYSFEGEGSLAKLLADMAPMFGGVPKGRRSLSRHGPCAAPSGQRNTP